MIGWLRHDRSAWTRRWSKLGLVLIAAAATSRAGADMAADVAKAKSALLGSGGRTWVKERVVVSMGGGARCEAGEIYGFKPNGTVEIVRCRDHVLSMQSFRWTVTGEPPIDVRLSFGAESFLLSFSGTRASPKMRWARPAQVKPDPSTDIYLGLSKD